jgi:hypothetical protein
MYFWNTNILDNIPKAGTIHLVLSILFLLWTMILLIRKPTAFLIYIVGIIGLLTFFYTKYFGSMRHWGFIFVLFVVSIWIEGYCRDNKHLLKFLNKISLIFKRRLGIVLTAILVIHFVSAVVASQFDYRYVFSEAEATAKFIKKEKMDDMIIAADEDTEVAPVSGYLGKELYYPRIHRFGSFWTLKQDWFPNATVDDILNDTIKLQNEKKQDLLIILNYPLDEQIMKEYLLTRVTEFTGSIIKDEQYYLYLMDYLPGKKRPMPILASTSYTKPGAVVIYLFDEGNGKVVKDSSGNGNDGQLINDPKWVDGKSGKALSFNGQNEYVEIVDNSSLDAKKAITLMAWVYPTRLSEKVKGIIAKWCYSGGNERSYLMATSETNNGIRFQLSPDGTGENEKTLISDVGLEKNKWTHIACVWDGSNMVIYLNGVEHGSIPYNQNIHAGRGKVDIGTLDEEADPNRVFNGIVDDVAIFNIALTKKQINNIMETGLNGLFK